jgi:hypothetical protein
VRRPRPRRGGPRARPRRAAPRRATAQRRAAGALDERRTSKSRRKKEKKRGRRNKPTGPFWLSWCHLKPLFGFTINKSVVTLTLSLAPPSCASAVDTGEWYKNLMNASFVVQMLRWM